MDSLSGSLILAAAAAAVVTALVLLLRRRTDPVSTELAVPGPSNVALAAGADAAETVLIPIPGTDVDQYLALGRVDGLALADQRPLGIATAEWRAQAAKDVTLALNVPLQAANAYQQSQWLVRLAPETVRQLKDGATFVESGGKAIGTLKGADGKFIAAVRLEPAAALATVASLGNALTMAAMQLQLAQISDKLDGISRQIEAGQKHTKNRELAELESLTRAVAAAYEQASAAGEVTDKVILDIAGKGQALDTQIRALEKDLRDRLSRRPGTGKSTDLMQWLANDGLASVEELQQLTVATQGWLMQRILYAANLGNSPSPADLTNQQIAHKQIKTRGQELGSLLSEMTYEIDRALYVAAVAPGSVPKTEHLVRLLNGSAELTSRRAAELGAQLRNVVTASGVVIPDVPRLEFGLTLGTNTDPTATEWRDLLRYMLRTGEVPKLCIEGKGVGGQNNPSTASSVLVITDQRVLGIRKKDFPNTARFAVELDRTSVKDARLAVAGLGKVRVPGLRARVLRMQYRGGAIDIDIDAVDEPLQRMIESEVRDELAGRGRPMQPPALLFGTPRRALTDGTST